MEATLGFPPIYHQLPLSSHRNLSVPLGRNEYRLWKKRRRLRSRPILALRDDLNPTPFQNLISLFPSINALDLIGPALGLASGAALYLSRQQTRGINSENVVSDIGEWILFTSPTPFNRFVVLRCPSISLEGSEMLEDVNERLVKEDRHFVRLNRGRIQVWERENGGRSDDCKKLVYQRVCIGTEDGGVLSLDWPANLGLEEEYGLDTTVLIVPGTAEGSMGRDIKAFVCACLRRGCFPVVMNPRGCAGSPLTSARLFTAADSDDISTAIQFVNKERPWSTLVGAGWGFGANMLTKYLAEVGEKTPLTAATCIDNPFDLEEATRSSPYQLALDQHLTGGLIDILRSNKELFQGRSKGFHVDKALLATSVRDFEKAISMVSYGFNAIEDFYAKSSTRNVVGRVKIPLLFIQSDDKAVPLYSVPRSTIAENPFTSLLLCSHSPSSGTTNSMSASSWCQNITIEWLTAVELGLLKGRHPVLKDVDVTINPSKGLSLVAGGASNRSSKVNKLLDLPKSGALDGYLVYPSKEMFKDNGTASNVDSRYGQNPKNNALLETKQLQQENNGTLPKGDAVDEEMIEERGMSQLDGEKGHVLQTAQVVMNMLDVTMPDTLTEDQKKKVLKAVSQGETLMKALQDAVPEDVCGKLTAAVSGILQNQGSNKKSDTILHIGDTSYNTSGLKSSVQEKSGEMSNVESTNENSPSTDQKVNLSDPTDSSDKSQFCMDKTLEGIQSEIQVPQNLESDRYQSKNNHGGDVIGSDRKDINDLENNNETAASSERNEIGSMSSTKPELSSFAERASVTEDIITDQFKMEENDGKNPPEIKEEKDSQQNEEKTGTLGDQNKRPSSSESGYISSPLPASLESQTIEKESDDNQKAEEEKNVQFGLSQSTPAPARFSVSQALDALTGIDDSTQAAVNNVFHVIEDMITQLEVERNHENEAEDAKNEDSRNTSEKLTAPHTTKSSIINDNPDSGNTMDNGNKVALHSDDSEDTDTHKQLESEEGPKERTLGRKESDTYVDHKENMSVGEKRVEEQPVREKSSAGNAVKSLTHDFKTHQDYITMESYGDPPYREYLCKYLISKIGQTKRLDIDSTAGLLLNYFPEEGQWKLLDKLENDDDFVDDMAKEGYHSELQNHFPLRPEDTDNIIEPSYVILDADKQAEPGEKRETADQFDSPKTSKGTSESSLLFIKRVILDSLKLEVDRRVSGSDIEEMESKISEDLEYVAGAVSLAVSHGEEHVLGKDISSEKVGILHGEDIVRAISVAVNETTYLRRVLPVGVIVGTTLAALRNFFDVKAVDGNSQSKGEVPDKIGEFGDTNNLGRKGSNKMNSMSTDGKSGKDDSTQRSRVQAESRDSNSKSIMVDAVTAALGASALLVNTQDPQDDGMPSKEKEIHKKDHKKLEDETSEHSQCDIVMSLAEKAMTVAGPVVPTKEDGELDQERLVAMLAELGQKGGILKLVGRLAMLWGGMRGAMSLTDRLISFLRIAERPLFQRIIGFVCMTLVVWSPVTIPLLPTLVQSWMTHNSCKAAELACIIGLYISIMLMVALWGKRIRGYENPLEQYGLDLTSSSKVQDFSIGLVGGVTLVLLIHSVNNIIGCVSLSCPATLLALNLDAVTWLKVYGRLLLLIVQGFAIASGIALVEELLFRSWLPNEIAADLGYLQGVIISGLAFSLFQRSPLAIPGLWLVSLGLSGARQRSQGGLFLPIGLRAGILASSFILQTGGFLTYQSRFPRWVTGPQCLQPFGGVVGIGFSLLFAIILHPTKSLHKRTTPRTIREETL